MKSGHWALLAFFIVAMFIYWHGYVQDSHSLVFEVAGIGVEFMGTAWA